MGKNPGVEEVSCCTKGKKILRGYMISREVRNAEHEWGFEILDLSSGRRGWLTHINREHARKWQITRKHRRS